MAGATRFKSKLWSHIFENGKVALYVATPIVTVFVFSQPDIMERIVRNRMYVIYPAEGRRPPTTIDEAREHAAQIRNARQ
mmetsp:Transcript_18390/g.49472  ORF Transcript_18390/g.49472 Transcript_18390/m.49472 type:complete len:80 (-) Transcript_18390:300-539(-)